MQVEGLRSFLKLPLREELMSWRNEWMGWCGSSLACDQCFGAPLGHVGITASLLFAVLSCLLFFAKRNSSMCRNCVPISISEPATENSQGCWPVVEQLEERLGWKPSHTRKGQSYLPQLQVWCGGREKRLRLLCVAFPNSAGQTQRSGFA